MAGTRGVVELHPLCVHLDCALSTASRLRSADSFCGEAIAADHIARCWLAVVIVPKIRVHRACSTVAWRSYGVALAAMLAMLARDAAVELFKVARSGLSVLADVDDLGLRKSCFHCCSQDIFVI